MSDSAGMDVSGLSRPRPRRGLRWTAPVCLPFVLLASDARAFCADTSPYRVAVRHVLLVHRDAFDGKPSSRTLDEARRLAADLRGQVIRGELTFTDASRRFSDDHARRAHGGFFGIFRRGELSDSFASFEKAVFALSEGGLAAVVESPLGVHLVERVRLEEWRARHVLVRYRGARGSSTEVTRTRDEARSLARLLSSELRKACAGSKEPVATFARFARRHSDDPDRVSGGQLGVFGFGEKARAICLAVRGLDVGEISAPIESALGFHVLLREKLAARRFVIEYRPAGKIAAGRRPRRSLGTLPVERLPQGLRDAARALRIGESSAPIESRDAWTVVTRLPLAAPSVEREPSPARPAERPDGS